MCRTRRGGLFRAWGAVNARMEEFRAVNTAD